MEYIGWSIEIPCTENMLDDLHHEAEQMERRLHAWNDEVVHARKMFYELNYYTTTQLLMLRKDMAQMKNRDMPCTLCPSALALLQSVSATVNMDTVCNVVHRVCGQHFEVLFDGPIQQHVECSTFPAEPSLSATILASIDEHTSSTSAAKSIISKCDESALSIEQMEIITYLTERFQYNEKRVLKALQECGEDYYECLNWCNENDGLLSFSDDEEETESDGEMSSDTDSEAPMDIPTTGRPYTILIQFCA